MEIGVVRAMPNTPSMLGAGIAALSRGRYATEQQLDLASLLFATVGRTVIVEEKHLDAVTGLSGCGPAFIYIILESLAEAGVKVGLPRDIATLLAAQTTFGAAKMVLETGYHPALLEGRSHHAGGLHHRWHPGAGRGRPPRHPDQGRDARHPTRQGTGRVR